jgi:hypothetical protein
MDIGPRYDSCIPALLFNRFTVDFPVGSQYLPTLYDGLSKDLPHVKGRRLLICSYVKIFSPCPCQILKPL